MKILTTLVSLAFLVQMAYSQSDTLQSPAYTGEDGKIYWNKNAPIYLRIASTPDEKGVLLKSEDQSQYSNPIYLDTEGVNYIRTRNAVNNQTKEVVLPHQEVALPIYADGTAPISKATFQNAIRYTNNGIEYLGKGIRIALSGADNQSGLKEIYYAKGQNDFELYTDTIDFVDASGSSSLKFFAVDNVGNKEKENQVNLVLDYAPPKTTLSYLGPQINNTFTFKSKFKFEATDSLSGVSSIFYKFDSGDYQIYTRNIEIDQLSDGYHQITYYSVDNVNNREEEISYEFYLDISSPITSAVILGDRFIVEDKIYFSGRSKLKLTAVDNRAGVKEIKYSINEKDFVDYTKPFYLPSRSGIHKIRYYSVDNFNNKTNSRNSTNGFQEFKHIATKVYVDLTGPDLSFDYEGPALVARDTLFVSSDTKIILKATDSESGMRKITYNLGESAVEYDYKDPFQFKESGYRSVDYYGYDNVNNRNVSHLNIFVDSTGPHLISSFSRKFDEGNSDRYLFHSSVKVYLAAQDDHTGLQDISYSLNGGAEVYNSAIISLKKNGVYKIKVTGSDLLGNETEKEIEVEINK
ncbi:OmpL47-type beta-barrel domain-containing protein [Reichenbachiella versicolor]|uniref:OmpL47-type beta-barrel domain-containing protein n=1 Tax=Reichenbachiella versicolor TaxID=1821036 RepID=UPI0013A52E36|nr:hypothetical protein [Reichenbachiella versicolor]